MLRLAQVEKLTLFTFVVSSMLAVGLSLGLKSLFVPLRDVRFALVALGLNFVLAPALAWLLTVTLRLEPGHAIGLLLLGSAAGAPFLPNVIRKAGCDEAHAASLLVLLTLGTIVFMPLVPPRLMPNISMDAWAIARPLLFSVLAPLVLGMLIKAVLPAFASGAARALQWIGNSSLLLLFVLLIGLNVPLLLGVVGSGALAAAALHFIALFAAGWLLGGSLPRVRGVMGLGASARNFGAAFVPVAGNIRDPGVPVMLTASAIVGLLLSFLAARWMQHHTTPLPA